MSLDHEIRIAAFQWLAEQVNIHGDVLPRMLLSQGFIFKDLRIPLVSPQGIFRPQMLEYPLTITTTPDGHMMTDLEVKGSSYTNIEATIISTETIVA